VEIEEADLTKKGDSTMMIQRQEIIILEVEEDKEEVSEAEVV
jgi:hypothetical protein